jgi:type IV pilus assembly protein PilE
MNTHGLPTLKPLRERGVTLVELMTVIAIVGILGAIAYPSYIRNMVKSRRASAQTHLMDIAQQQQQYLLDARAYASSLTALNISTPGNVSTYYSVTLSATAGPPPSFTITATPLTGSSQASDGPLTINSSGAKTPSNVW